MTGQNEEVYLTTNDLASMLQLTRTGITGLARRGILPKGIKIGGARRWPLQQVRECLAHLAANA